MKDNKYIHLYRKEVIDDAINDADRIANVAINDKNEVVGFFVLTLLLSA